MMQRARHLLLAAVLIVAAFPHIGSSQGTPMPFVRAQFFDNNGDPCNGCLLNAYAAGTTTRQDTFTTITLTLGTENANPIVLNSAGRPTTGYIYLSATSYRFVLTDSTGATTYWDSDNTPSIPSTAGNTDITGQTAGVALSAGDLVYLSDGSNSLTAGRWYLADADFYYASIHPVLGFVPTAIASGATGTIRLAGLMTGLTGLTSGTTYYVSSTAAGLTATAPANARSVGQSVSTTTLAINIASAWILDAGQSIKNMDGRLTLTTAVPVTTSDVTAAGTIYYTPYSGNRVSLFDGTRWKEYSFSEVSLALTCTSGKPYDVWLYDNAGTLTLETLVWTNDTTRATALVRQDGVFEKTGALTRRYIASFYCTAMNQTEDSVAKRNVYNQYNRVRRAFRRIETTASWPYSTATIRQANGSALNQVEAMIGTAETAVDLHLLVTSANNNADILRLAAFGEDSTTTFSLNGAWNSNKSGGPPANQEWVHVATLSVAPAVGRRTFTWLEDSGATATTTWRGIIAAGGADQSQSGITGSIEN